MKTNTSILALCVGLMAAPAYAQDQSDSELCADDLADAALCADEDSGEFFIGTVTVRESRRGVQTDTAASQTVIDQDEIDARNATTTGQLIDSIPNVSLINGILPQGSGVSVRGLGSQAGTYGTAGKVNFVVDGVVSGAEEIYRNGSFLSLEPELFKQLDVVRGPANGFRFSGGAIGGTVEATTKDARDFLEDGDTFSFRQKLGYESNGNGTLTTSILSFAPDEDFDVLAFFGRRTAENREDGAGAELTGTEFEQTAAMVKANYHLNADSKLTFGYLTGNVPERDVFYSAYDPSFSSEKVDRDTKDTTGYLEYSYNPVDNDAINLTTRLQFKKEEIELNSLSSPSAGGIYEADHQTKTLSLRVENEAVLSSGALQHNLLTGIEVGRRERTSLDASTGFNDISAPGGTDDFVAVYVTDEIEVNDRFTVTPQLRFERQELTSQNNGAGFSRGSPVAAIPDGTSYTAQALTGALSLRYELTDSVAVFGTAAYNENLPILDDLRSATNIVTSEKARSFEVGVSYDTIDVFAGGDGLKAKVTAYQSEITDVTTYFGVDDVRLWGAEVEVSYANPNFYVDFNAGSARGEINGGTAHFNQAPGETAQLTVGKLFMDDQLDLSLEVKHAWANTRTSSTSGATAPSDDWTIYSVAASYTPDSGVFEDVQFNASVENLLDTEYRAYGNTRNGVGRTFKFSVAKTF